MPQNITGSNTWVGSTTGPSVGDVKTPSDIITPVQDLMNRTQFNYSNISALQTSVGNLSSQVTSLDGQVQTLTTAPNLVFNVKAYGATGDGSTNDTAAIQAAFDAAYTAAGNTTNALVFFPRGTYRTGLVNVKCNVDGAGAIIKSNTTTLTNCFTVGSGFNNITISNMTFDGNLAGAGPGNNYTGTYGLNITLANNVTVINCRFQNCMARSLSADRSQNFQLLNSLITGTRGILSQSVSLSGVNGAFISGNTISDFTGRAVYSGSTGTTACRKLIVAFNTVKNAVADATAGAGNRGIDLSGISMIIQGNRITNLPKSNGVTTGIIVGHTFGVAVPSAPTLATSASGGSIAAGAYYAKVTHVTEEGETLASAESTVINTTGSSSTITVTGPNMTTGVTNVKAVNVYLTPTTASPGTEIYAGQYTTGSTLVLTALPSGTSAPPTISTANSGAGILITDNTIDIGDFTAANYGIYVSENPSTVASNPLFIRDNQISKCTTGVYLENKVGPLVDISDNHFEDIRLINSTASGVIAIANSTQTQVLPKISISNNTKVNIDYSASGNAVGDIHVSSVGAGISLLEMNDLTDSIWSITNRVALGSIAANNCNLRLDNASYNRSLFFAPTVRYTNCKFSASRNGSAQAALHNSGTVNAILSDCTFDTFTITGNALADHVIRINNSIFTASQLIWERGSLFVSGSDVTSVPTGGFIRGLASAVSGYIYVNGGNWVSSSENFIQRTTADPTELWVSNVRHSGAKLISGVVSQSVIKAEDIHQNKLRISSTPGTVTEFVTEVYVDLTVASPSTINIPAANTTNRGRKILIIDNKGDALTNNITIVPASGTISGAANYVITTNSGSVTLSSNPDTNSWAVIATSVQPIDTTPSYNNYNLDLNFISGYNSSLSRGVARRVKVPGVLKALASSHKLLSSLNQVELTNSASAPIRISDSLAMRNRSLIYRAPASSSVKFLTGIPISDSVNGSNAASNAFNGTQTNYWASNLTGTACHGSAYIGLDLGTPKVINRVVIYNPDTLGSNSYADQAMLQYSDNGSTWSTVQVLDNLSQVNLASTSFEVYSSPLARYWRVLCNSGIGSGASWSVAQVNFYEASAALIGRVRDGVLNKAHVLHGTLGSSGNSNFSLFSPSSCAVHPVTGEIIILDTVNNKIKKLDYTALTGFLINDCNDLTGVTQDPSAIGGLISATSGVWVASSYGTAVNSEYRGAGALYDLGQTITGDFSVTATFGWDNLNNSEMGRLHLDVMDASNNVLASIGLRDGSNGVAATSSEAFIGTGGTTPSGLASPTAFASVSNSFDGDVSISRVGSTWAFSGPGISWTGSHVSTPIRKFRIRSEAYGLSGTQSPSTRQNCTRIIVTGLSSAVYYSYYETTTVIGTGAATSVDNAVASLASTRNPKDVVFSADGSTMYWTDSTSHVIRKASVTVSRLGSTQTAQFSNVVTIAGASGTSGNLANATGTSARFNEPSGLSINPAGTHLIVADTLNHNLKLISLTAPYAVSIFAGDAATTPSSGNTESTGTSARFNAPAKVLWFNPTTIYVTDSNNHTVRSVSYPGAVTSLIAGAATVAGDTDSATGTSARFRSPTGMVYDPSTQKLYVSEALGNRIKAITLALPYAVETKFGSTAAASGTLEAIGTSARFNSPSYMAVTSGAELLVADSSNHVIKTIPLLEHSIDIFTDTSIVEGDIIFAHSLLPNEEYSLSLAVEV